jgi:hypothetical protein
VANAVRSGVGGGDQLSGGQTSIYNKPFGGAAKGETTGVALAARGKGVVVFQPET